MSTPADPAVDVVIVGGGPTGLMLASELRLGGADAVVLERLPEISEIPKGNGLVGQIVPLLDYRGLLDRFRAETTFVGPVPQFQFGPLQMNFSRLGASPLHILAMPQRRLEQLLDERLQELGGRVRRGHELIALAQDADRVTLDVRGADGDYRLRTRYLVGCDGAHSLVRKQAGIGFPGVTWPDVSRIGRVFLPTAELAPDGGHVDLPEVGRVRIMGMNRTPRGTYSLAPLASLDKNAPPGFFIVFTREDDAPTAEQDPAPDAEGPMTLDELRASVRRVIGADLPMSDPQWLTRIFGNSRQADRYRAGRVLLAGDAAHIFGAGGSLNVGLLDALNLGWKIAAQVQGWAPAGLLDSYHTERYAAGQRTLQQTRAQRALSAKGETAEALRGLFDELIQFPEPLRHLGEAVEGSDVRYEMPAGTMRPHPLLGRVAPDLHLETAGGRTRVAELMRAARGVLLDFTDDSAVCAAAADWSDRVSAVAVRCVIEPAPAAALLIRPDGYVAWTAGPHTTEPAAGLEDALRAWFG